MFATFILNLMSLLSVTNRIHLMISKEVLLSDSHIHFSRYIFTHLQVNQNIYFAFIGPTGRAV
jgi:NADH:ubiquinone oxidoreductase subunit K